MAKFCGNCGSPLIETAAFCGACGARVAQANVPLASTPVPPSPVVPWAPPVSSLPPASPLPVRQGTSPVLKIILVVLVILFIGGALATFGIFYAIHLASRKAHEFSRRVRAESGIMSSLNTDSGNGNTTAAGTSGPGACRLLSKEDVSRFIGITVVATRTTPTGCEYLAKGTSAEMAAKHIAAMMAARGASAQQQQMFQSLSKGLLNSKSETDGSDQNADVNSVVLAFTIDPNSSRSEMALNQNVLGGMGPGGKPLAGIGDEAFDTAGAVMLIRKGDKLIRIVYSTCPCALTAIKPLAQQLAAAM
jgi:hypothetical protein